MGLLQFSAETFDRMFQVEFILGKGIFGRRSLNLGLKKLHDGRG